MASAFRKISRVGSLTGGTRWYLSDDCLLAAKVVMYAVEYRRFYLRDLESVVVSPSRLWLLRPIIPGLVLAALGAWLLHSVSYTAGAIVGGLALAWVALERALGPTAKSRIRTTGATVDLPLVKRTRSAPKVLAKIDAAVRATRGAIEQTTTANIAQRVEPSVQTTSETSSTTSTADATQTNAS